MFMFRVREIVFIKNSLNNNILKILHFEIYLLLDNLIVYLAAHNIDLALKRKGSGGQVKSIREGALSIDYAVNSNITSEFDMSSYGGKYMALVKSAIIAPLTRSC